jgi:hypothetical protein
VGLIKTLDEFARELRAIERVLSERVHIWRVFTNPDGGTQGERVYRGSFQRPRDPQEEEKKKS